MVHADGNGPGERRYGIIPAISARTLACPYLSACVGVAVIKPHFPFHSTYHLAEELLKSAKVVKRRVRQLRADALHPCSALDFHVLYDTYFSDIEKGGSPMNQQRADQPRDEEVIRRLRRDEETFWDKLRRPNANTTDLYINEYINDLLPREMWEEHLPRQSSACDILVLLVGFSFEPLLQSICYYNPQSVLLVLNEKYGDQTHTEMKRQLQQLIRALYDKGLISLQPTVMNKNFSRNEPKYVQDEPEQVFRFLCKHLIRKLRDEKRVTIDVTGAKKSMGTGAYLFGAYTNTRISYVDFGEYNARYGRPYGDSHRIGLLENPYKAFQLRNWEQVRYFYRGYAFRTASQLLKQIKSSMESSLEKDQKSSGTRLFDPEHTDAVDRLIQVLKFYELWDGGDYQKARTTYKGFASVLSGFSSPYAVDVLGSYWPCGDNLLDGIKKLEIGNDQTPSLYVRDPDLLVYAKDELAKIGRLIENNEDYRSALVRSVGLEEVLLKARITCLWEKKLLEIAESDPETQKPGDFHPMDKLPSEIEDWLTSVFEGIVLTDSIIPVLIALRSRPNKEKDLKAFACKKKQGRESFRKFFFVRRHDKAPLLNKKIILGEERDLRNKAVHTYLSVPQATANDVYGKVKANFDDFVQDWKQFMRSATTEVNLDDPRRFEIVDWDLLCKWCKIDEFLPPISEEQEGN